MRGAVATFVLLAACVPPPSKFPASKARSPVNVEVVMPGALEAATIARAEWQRRLSVPLPAKLPRVRWFDGDPLSFKGLTLKVHSQFSVRGDEIQITATPGGKRATKPSDTDLAHEMLHWALHHSTGDGDAAHALPIWNQDGAVCDAMRAEGF